MILLSKLISSTIQTLKFSGCRSTSHIISFDFLDRTLSLGVIDWNVVYIWKKLVGIVEEAGKISHLDSYKRCTIKLKEYKF